ncbi:hypothetical protein [Nocardioides plantarum]|uniref:hypothetical protein n=1 Tax=Nocardioides plantarum TaxID=29299 RepID=UPI001120FF93|nr:hypothetical protein [Nocardioides plantarum]
MRSGATHVRLALVCALIGALVVAQPAAAPVRAEASLPLVGRSDPARPVAGLVSASVAAGTPHVLDGRVLSVAQVGRTIVLGGTFTRVREAGRPHTFVRRGLVAFDAVTGRVRRGFDPGPSGDVRVVLPAADGLSVYVGGKFTSIAGTRQGHLARVRIGDGSPVRSFRPGRVTGSVKDLALVRGRLWVAGAFTHVDGHPQRALATLSPRTGRWSGYMSLALRGHHRRGVTQVLKISATPGGGRVVVIGNFDTVAGTSRHQLAVLDTTGRRARTGGLRTTFYTSRCSPRVDTTMRDVDVSPDGRYFVVGTTGGYGGHSGSCDTVARFETDAVGRDVVPSWVDYSGGDTTFSVEATTAAVYVGGHQRWWNNPDRSGAPGEGAVARRGVAALDPLNGLPLTWNPGRDLGVGVFDFLATPDGLWVASDTTRIAGRTRGRIARFLPGGAAVPAASAATLPADVYVGGAVDDTLDPPPSASGARSTLRRREFTGAGPAAPATPAPDGDLDWTTVRGAFVAAGDLHVAGGDGRLTRRCFDGASYGPATDVSTSDRLVAMRGWASDVRRASGMFFDQGRIYFTLVGSPYLFYRYFTPASGVVGARRLVASRSVPGFDPARVRGMFVGSDTLFWSDTHGTLRSVAWRPGWPSGHPGGAPSVQDATGGDWTARSLFVLPRVDRTC